MFAKTKTLVVCIFSYVITFFHPGLAATSFNRQLQADSHLRARLLRRESSTREITTQAACSAFATSGACPSHACYWTGSVCIELVILAPTYFSESKLLDVQSACPTGYTIAPCSRCEGAAKVLQQQGLTANWNVAGGSNKCARLTSSNQFNNNVYCGLVSTSIPPQSSYEYYPICLLETPDEVRPTGDRRDRGDGQRDRHGARVRDSESLGRSQMDYQQDSAGPSILYDGKNVMKTEFVYLPGQFAEEYFFSVEAAKFGITVTDTHVLMPMGTNIQFNFIRRWHTTEDEHVGVVNQRFAENSKEILDQSLLADDITVGVAEKMHIYYTKKQQDTSAYERAMADLKESDETGNKSEDYYERNALTVIASGISMPPMALWWELGGSSQTVMEFANGDDAPTSFAQRASELRSAMNQRFAKLQSAGMDFSDPKISSTNCFHWGNVLFDVDKELVYFPLGKKINSYRGHEIAAPYVSMSVVQGTSVFTYDQSTGMLEIYMGVSKETTIGDPYAEQPMGHIALAAADGEGEPIKVPNWSDQEESILGRIAYRTLELRNRKYKADWHFLFRDYDEICPPEHYAKLDFWYDQLVETRGGVMRKAAMSLATAKVWLNLIQCATSFLRPDHVNGAEFNEYISNAVMHGLLEMPKRFVKTTFAARDWQYIDTSLIPGMVPIR